MDDANDELKIQLQEDYPEEVRRPERRKTRLFSFDNLGEDGVSSGSATPYYNRKGGKGKVIVESAADHLREMAFSGSSDEEESSFDAVDKGKNKGSSR